MPCLLPGYFCLLIILVFLLISQKTLSVVILPLFLPINRCLSCPFRKTCFMNRRNKEPMYNSVFVKPLLLAPLSFCFYVVLYYSEVTCSKDLNVFSVLPFYISNSSNFPTISYPSLGRQRNEKQKLTI